MFPLEAASRNEPATEPPGSGHSPAIHVDIQPLGTSPGEGKTEPAAESQPAPHRHCPFKLPGSHDEL